MNLIFFVTNISQLDTAIEIASLKEFSIELIVVNQVGLSKGLEKKAKDFKKEFTSISFFKLSDRFKKVQLLKLVLYFWYRAIKSKSLISKKNFIVTLFTEGGRYEWIIASICKSFSIKSVCMQWALTWNPKDYQEINPGRYDMEDRVGIMQKILGKILCYRPVRMNYLGDGACDKVFTLGRYWKEQLELNHPSRKKKFVATGNPRFKYSTSKKENIITFATGAGTAMYGNSIESHLENIKNVYQGTFEFCNEKRWILVHKLHPRDKATERIQSLSQNYPHVKVMTTGDTAKLLKKSKLTLVFRSTVGLEALLSNNKLIVIDYSSIYIGFDYSKFGLAEKVHTNIELDEKIREVVTKENVINNNIYNFVEQNSLENIKKAYREL